MKVTLIARTVLEIWPESIYGTDFQENWVNTDPMFDDDADWLAHFAGRSCYQSWDVPNPATATNHGYMANIIDHGHFSVLEHATASFYVEGVSRALLAELTRHRHASFSVESQRYVDYSDTEPVIPPAMRGTFLEESLREEYDRALVNYADYVNDLKHLGYSRKEAREAARAVLPNCAPVSMVISGNMRAFRDILFKRYSKHADAEVRELATELLRQLRLIASASFQDFPEEPFE